MIYVTFLSPCLTQSEYTIHISSCCFPLQGRWRSLGCFPRNICPLKAFLRVSIDDKDVKPYHSEMFRRAKGSTAILPWTYLISSDLGSQAGSDLAITWMGEELTVIWPESISWRQAGWVYISVGLSWGWRTAHVLWDSRAGVGKLQSVVQIHLLPVL